MLTISVDCNPSTVKVQCEVTGDTLFNLSACSADQMAPVWRRSAAALLVRRKVQCLAGAFCCYCCYRILIRDSALPETTRKGSLGRGACSRFRTCEGAVRQRATWSGTFEVYPTFRFVMWTAWIPRFDEYAFRREKLLVRVCISQLKFSHCG